MKKTLYYTTSLVLFVIYIVVQQTITMKYGYQFLSTDLWQIISDLLCINGLIVMLSMIIDEKKKL